MAAWRTPKPGNFNPLPSHEGRLGEYLRQGGDIAISIHSPLTRGDRILPRSCRRHRNFNPLPSHEGRRRAVVVAYEFIGNFNPLPSHEGRRSICWMEGSAWEFQSTPLSRGETLPAWKRRSTRRISIHSPLTRGDE